MALQNTPSTIVKYIPPEWASKFLQNIPEHRLHLANLPTPLYQIPYNKSKLTTTTSTSTSNDNHNTIMNKLQNLNIKLFIKRDDMTAGIELGGNKVRKLEFLLASALQQTYDSVLTIGGEQSNHCRATAAACRMVGLDPYLILRTKRANQVAKDEIIEKDKQKNEDNFGFVGNVLVDRMVGSHIYTCTPGEYGRVGSKELVRRVCSDIEKETNKKVYPIPVGGSNGLGTWGYIQGVDEVVKQLNGQQIDHVLFACGSGGTAAGIGLGFALSYLFQNNIDEMPKIHPIGVCDTPEYFYNEIANIANEMGIHAELVSSLTQVDNVLDFIRQIVTPHQGKGLGYAMSTQEELDFIARFAIETGIVLDPVYSGKALYHFVMHELNDHPEMFQDSNVLFWHTGGALGLYDKVDALSSTLAMNSPVQRIDVYGKRDTKK